MKQPRQHNPLCQSCTMRICDNVRCAGLNRDECAHEPKVAVGHLIVPRSEGFLHGQHLREAAVQFRVTSMFIYRSSARPFPFVCHGESINGIEALLPSQKLIHQT